MRTALLVDLFQQLPAIPDGDFFSDRAVGLQTHLERFRTGVTAKYSEGTLQRLLEANAVQIRRAALLALGLVGTMESNAAVSARLLDEETQVRRLAADALWNIWFRAEGDVNGRELQRVAHLKDLRKCLRGLNNIIERFLESRRTGFYLRVLREGILEAGVAIDWIQSETTRVTIRELVDLYANKHPERSQIERVLSARGLSASWRGRFQSMLG